jgi:hypothetical protein
MTMSSSTPQVLAALPSAVAPYIGARASAILDEWAVLLKPVPALVDSLCWRTWVPSDPNTQRVAVGASASTMRLLREASRDETIVAVFARLHPDAACSDGKPEVPEAGLPHLAGWAVMAALDARVTPTAFRVWRELPREARGLVR